MNGPYAIRTQVKSVVLYNDVFWYFLMSQEEDMSWYMSR